MRLACVFVPQIALQAVLRRSPELRGKPVALVEGVSSRRSSQPASGRASGRAKVVTISAEARRAGVRTGLTAAQAAAACAELTLLPIAIADVEAAEAALADLGFAFAARIDREPGRIFFEIGDLGQLYPSEAAVTQAIQARAIHLGLGVRVAIAARKGVARVATRASERAVVPTGREAAFLAPLPLRVLGEPLAVDLCERFERWGIGTVGAFANLPTADVGLRLGADGVRLHRLARGEDDDAFLPSLPADAVEENVELDDAIIELEPLSFVLRGVFDRVLARLACRSLACAGMTLRFQLESRAFDVHDINLAAPTREAAPLLQLARLDLTRRPPDAPIVAVLVVARPARVRTTQLDFLRPAGPAPDRLAATIARLGALCGPDNVGAPRTEDTWREEAVGVATFVLAQATDLPVGARSAAAGAPANAATATAATTAAAAAAAAATTAAATAAGSVRALTIRRYRPPEEIEVMLGPDGPSALRGKDTTARILVAAGPYRLSGEWWRPGDADRDDDVDRARRLGGAPGAGGAHAATGARDATGMASLAGANDNDAAAGDRTRDRQRRQPAYGFSRDYWDVHASDGTLYRLHHDRHRDRWYLDGYYD